MENEIKIALIKGDGIGIDVAEAAQAVINRAIEIKQLPKLAYCEIEAGARYYQKTGLDIEPNGEEMAEQCDAILLGAIGLPTVRTSAGTEIMPHLRLRERMDLYAAVRPVRAYSNTPQRLSDPRAAEIDLIILRENTEGLFYTASTSGRLQIANDYEVRETLRITRSNTEKLHRFAFRLARKRKHQGKNALLTCVDKANVFKSMAFFRKIFDEIAMEFPDIETSYSHVDAQALDMVRRPWEFGILVMENIFGDILSDLGGGLVGGMGMAPCAEIGDRNGLFQPSHGTAPDIMGQDLANPLAGILAGSMMLDYLAESRNDQSLADCSTLIDQSIERGFDEGRLRPCESGGDMGTQAITEEVIALINETEA
ncbi:MAG: isocitrate/isopropylmalate family dehydrogenase [Gammaproteobacteria bacterium]|nr:isocitrate/isopropylmalate family dehydrogenase [Gammaproteobacteria bacterium]